ncbi:MAG TPA: hypothetical protein VIG99_24845 [Myxococcaceae bacterium]|jgi:hypothetical protein
MKLQAALAVLVAVTLAQLACDSGGAALVAAIQLDPGVQATCVSLTVTEPGTSRLLAEKHVPRGPGQNDYRIAIWRATPSGPPLPEEVVLQALALAGPNGCAAPLNAVSFSEAVSRAFPAAGTAEVPLSVSRVPQAPDALQIQAITSPIQAGQCVNTAVRTTLGGTVMPALADTPITLLVDPDAGLATFTDGTCTTPASAATLPVGSAVLPFQLRGQVEGSYVVTASAAGLDSGTAAVSVTPGQSATLAFSSAAWTGLSGACLGPVRLRAEDGTGAPMVLTSNASITLSGPAGVTFFPDAACANAATSVVLGSGQPDVLVYFRSRPAGSVALTASATGLGNPAQAQQIVPNVRTGTCALGAGTAALTCPIPAPGVFDLSKAFLMVQAITADNTPSGVNVRCRLSSATAIDCSRAAGVAGVDVQWHLVELASGILVQRVNSAQCVNNVIPLPQAVDPAKTFTLFTGEHSGNDVDANDYLTVRLLAGDQVEILNDTTCTAGITDVQVIELQGAAVERGVLDAGAVPSISISVPPAPALSRSFLLTSARFLQSASKVCGYQIRGELTSASTIAFTRGNGNTAECLTPEIGALAWERVTLPAGATTQQVRVDMGDGESSASTSITPVDPARSFAFASGQFTSGAAFGETTYNVDDQPGAVGARYSLGTGSRLEMTRALDAGNAKWTSYVVELP